MLVVDEIEQIHKVFGFNWLNIVDDTFTLNHRHAHAVCDEIMRRNLKIEWTVFARADTVTTDILKKMRQAGCSWLLYGAEGSGSLTPSSSVCLAKARRPHASRWILPRSLTGTTMPNMVSTCSPPCPERSSMRGLKTMACVSFPETGRSMMPTNQLQRLLL
jgi:hypothetical protein